MLHSSESGGRTEIVFFFNGKHSLFPIACLFTRFCVVQQILWTTRFSMFIVFNHHRWMQRNLVGFSFLWSLFYLFMEVFEIENYSKLNMRSNVSIQLMENRKKWISKQSFDLPMNARKSWFKIACDSSIFDDLLAFVLVLDDLFALSIYTPFRILMRALQSRDIPLIIEYFDVIQVKFPWQYNFWYKKILKIKAKWRNRSTNSHQTKAKQLAYRLHSFSTTNPNRCDNRHCPLFYGNPHKFVIN